MGKIIEFKDLNFEYSENIFFENFNMSINENDIVSLIGPSASGKTTLLKMLCHKLPNDACYYKGKCFKDIPVETLKKEIVVVFDLPVKENNIKNAILHYIKTLNLSDEFIEKQYEKIKKSFQLDELEGKQVSELSFRELYLIKILRYLIIEPSFLAIDSIFSLLDETNKKELIKYKSKKSM